MSKLPRHEAFRNAIEDVEKGVGIRKSAKYWGISPAGLWKRVNGRVAQEKPGRRQVLSVAEEERFTQWLIERSDRGFGVTKNEFLDAVKTFLDKDQRQTRFNDNRPGHMWYRGFLKRNPQAKLRSARPLEKKRSKITSTDLDKWFTQFKKFLQELGLLHRPEQIWNCDECSFDLRGRTGRVIGPSASKEQLYSVTTETKEHVTVLPCFNATGKCIPPYIIFPGKRIPSHYNLLEGSVPGSVFSLTKKGSMDTPTLYKWMANHFIPHLSPERPVVLLIDGAGQHIDLETLELARKNDVHLHALLKNTTHLVQPADVGVFGAMKQSWYESVRQYSLISPNTDINKKNFSSVFKKTWEDVMRPGLLKDVFRKSGIYPINRDQIDQKQINPSETNKNDVNSPDLSTNEQNSCTSSRKDAATALLSL